MHVCYQDILDLTSEEPKWFDENAVPRFCKFSPDKVPNIYARQAALYLIKCQACGKHFKVAESSYGEKDILMDSVSSIRESIIKGTLCFGDPPNINCCPSGPTMSSDTIRVLEYWTREKVFEWVRDKTLEVSFEQEEEGE
jgi:hypothetical protein